MVKGRDLNLIPGTHCEVITSKTDYVQTAHEVELIERLDMIQSGFYWLCKTVYSDLRYEIWPEEMLSGHIVRLSEEC